MEVLVTLVVTAFGLLGLAGLQYRVQMSDVESYQRAQALVLLQDMSSRISTNRGQALSYKFGSITHTDAAVRAQAVAHNLDCIRAV